MTKPLVSYTTSRLYDSPLANNAQILRAFLLANATAALFSPPRTRLSSSQRLNLSSLFLLTRTTLRAPWTSNFLK